MLSCVFKESLLLKWKALTEICTFDNAIVLMFVEGGNNSLVSTQGTFKAHKGLEGPLRDVWSMLHLAQTCCNADIGTGA